MENVQQIVVIVLERPNGSILVHRRSSSRKTYPNLFGLGAGGKVEPSEQPLAAALRELEEETGVQNLPLLPVDSFDFSDGLVRHRVHIFHGIIADIPNWDRREWSAVDWRSVADVEELATRGELCPDTLEVWRRFQQFKEAVSLSANV